MLSTTAPTAAPVIFENIVYGSETPQTRQTMDLILPESTPNAPLVLWMHGGGYRVGNKEAPVFGLGDSSVPPNGLEGFLDAGIGIAAMNYRLSTYDSPIPGFPALETPEEGPGSLWPAQLDDVRNAVNFLKANGDTYGYDASRMASIGASAGAHLSAMAGLKFPDEFVASVALFPWTDFYEMDADDAEVFPDNDHVDPLDPSWSPNEALGVLIGENEAIADAASPAPFASSLPYGQELPDFLIMHGTADTAIPYLQSQRLYEAILAQGGASKLELGIFEGLAHGGPGWDEKLPIAVNFIAESFADTSAPAPVPLPATFPLICVGIGALAAIRRRRDR